MRNEYYKSKFDAELSIEDRQARIFLYSLAHQNTGLYLDGMDKEESLSGAIRTISNLIRPFLNKTPGILIDPLLSKKFPNIF